MAEEIKVQDNNKRIAKNTLYLYLRMLITVGVSLYTSRIVLSTLGVSDYGIYNVTGGIIGMLGYVNTLLSGGTSRFITMDLGRGDMKELKRTFSIANTLAFAAAIIIVILGETIGLYFLNHNLNIDSGRMDAANWVYQCALFSSALAVIQTPYSAALISHEKMDIYAYMSIFDVTMKLLIVYVLLCFNFDKLKLYACLMLAVNFLNVIIYRSYCTWKFEECKFRFAADKQRFKEMLTFSGWNMIGAFSNILNNYGIEILLNLFFGTLVNAARGIALQMNSIIYRLFSNFQMASQPQIIKYYAQKEVSSMSRLIVNTSKYSAFLLLCFIIPTEIYAFRLLDMWLKEVPQYSVGLVRLILIQSLFIAIDAPIGMGINAVGKMKLPNLTSSLVYISIFPISYLAMWLGAGPLAAYIVYICATPIVLCTDLWILHKYAGFNRMSFLKDVLWPVFYIGAIGFVIPYLLDYWFHSENWFITLLFCAISAGYVALVFFFLGLTPVRRKQVISKVRSKFLHK